MTEREPLDPVLSAHLRAEREAAPRLSDEARARVLEGVLRRVAAAPPSAPIEGGPRASASTAGAMSRVAWFGSGAVVGLVIGVALGVGLSPAPAPTVEPPATSVISVPDEDRLVAPDSAISRTEDAGSSAPRSESLVVRPRERLEGEAPPEEAAPDDATEAAIGEATTDEAARVLSTTADERTLVDRARVALRRGDPHGALVALMEHERRFPDGVLREDRDRLAVEALVQEGRVEAARARITRYLRDYPEGAHRRALSEIAASLPPAP